MNRAPDLPAARSRRRFLALGAAAIGSIAVLPACGAGGTDGGTAGPRGPAAGSAFPVTLRDRFGPVTIAAAPTTVASVGRTDHDVLLALGIAPVSVYQFVPSMTRGVGAWAEPELGTARPVILTRPLRFEQIAALRPDLILDVQSLGDEAEHRTLSKIAPTVSLPAGTAPNTVSWQDSARIISTAVGRATDGKQLVADVETTLANAATANPSFAGRTVSILLGSGGNPGGYTTADTRMQVVTALGLTPSAYTTELDQTEFFVELSNELVNDADADIVILLTREGLSAADALARYPAIARSTFAVEDRLVIVEDVTISLALSCASVLSIPYAIKGLVPLLAAKLG
ncbi:MAG: ABC transporter substrate-binding protein [Pseudonocardiaceae bacterium]